MTIKDLFATMVVRYKTGRNLTTSGYSYIPAANLAAISGTAYILSIAIDESSTCAWGIWRVVDGVIDSTPVLHPTANRGGVSLNTNTGDAYYYHGGYRATTGNGTSTYGCSMALVQFVGVSASAAEDAIINATWQYYTRAYDTSSQTSARIYDTTAMLHDLVIVSRGNYLDVWEVTANGTATRIAGTTNAAATHNSSGGNYYIITSNVYMSVFYTIN